MDIFNEKVVDDLKELVIDYEEESNDFESKECGQYTCVMTNKVRVWFNPDDEFEKLAQDLGEELTRVFGVK